MKSDAIQLTFIGNAAFKFRLDNLDLYLDFPYHSGVYGYMEYDFDAMYQGQEGYVIYTHLHKDHHRYSVLKKTKLKPIYPRYWQKKQYVKELERDFGVTLEYHKTRHKWSLWHESIFIRWRGKTILIFGDTEHLYPFMQRDNIDMMILTPWALGNLSQSNWSLEVPHYVLCHHRTTAKAKREYHHNSIYYSNPFDSGKLHILEQGENLVF